MCHTSPSANNPIQRHQRLTPLDGTQPVIVGKCRFLEKIVAVKTILNTLNADPGKSSAERAVIGVGEWVSLASEPSIELTWTNIAISGSSGDIVVDDVSSDDNARIWKSASTTASVRIEAMLGNRLFASKVYTSILPSGIIVTQRGDRGSFAGDFWGISGELNIFLLPLSVNFSQGELLEGDSPARNTSGIFSSMNPGDITHYVMSPRASRSHPVEPNNEMIDSVSFRLSMATYRSPNGSMEWQIQNYYRPPVEGAALYYIANTVQQLTVVSTNEESATSSIFKGARAGGVRIWGVKTR